MRTYSIHAGQHDGLLDARRQRVQPSLRAALRALRSVLGVDRLYRVTCPDGIYCYRCLADLRADRDGSSAPAVISIHV
jgi:hypothetical protein